MFYPVLGKDVQLQIDHRRGKKGTVSIVTVFRQKWLSSLTLRFWICSLSLQIHSFSNWFVVVFFVFYCREMKMHSIKKLHERKRSCAIFKTVINNHNVLKESRSRNTVGFYFFFKESVTQILKQLNPDALRCHHTCPIFSYLICWTGGFLGPVRCVILSRGRWHTDSVNQIAWIWYTGGERVLWVRPGSFGPPNFVFRLQADLNEVHHVGWHRTQMKTRISSIYCLFIFPVIPSFLHTFNQLWGQLPLACSVLSLLWKNKS